VTEFKQETRTYCRNPRCRMKLPAPVSNEREAFCARGCHTSFYLHRCRVCEGPLDRKSESQKVCRKAKCRSAWRAGSGFGRYHGSPSVVSTPKNPINTGSKSRLTADRGIEWAIAVNSARIRAPRHVLNAVFGRVPVRDEAAEPERVAA
jgi:hypothetical protein